MSEEGTGRALSLIEKLAQIMGAFDVGRTDLSLTEITERSGVPKATVHRLASQLVSIGFLEKRGTTYRLGLRLFEMGQLVPRNQILRQAASGYIHELAQETGETVHLAIRQGSDVLYVDKLDPLRGVGQVSRVAGRYPIHGAATGKVLLAYASADVFASIVASGLRPVTRHTITSAVVLRQQLAKIRADGWGREVEEIRLGNMSLAAPIEIRRGSVVAAIAITGPIQRLRTAQERHVQVLRRVAAGISRRLQHPDSEPWVSR